jgi:hypothetical protein
VQNVMMAWRMVIGHKVVEQVVEVVEAGDRVGRTCETYGASTAYCTACIAPYCTTIYVD